MRTLFGNPLAPVTQDAWPLQHPVVASWIYTVILLVIAVPLALRGYRKRTSD